MPGKFPDSWMAYGTASLSPTAMKGWLVPFQTAKDSRLTGGD
jgi:hypothetical protein